MVSFKSKKTSASLDAFIKAAAGIIPTCTDPQKLKNDVSVQLIAEVFELKPLEVAVNIIKKNLDTLLKNDDEEEKKDTEAYEKAKKECEMDMRLN